MGNFKVIENTCINNSAIPKQCFEEEKLLSDILQFPKRRQPPQATKSGGGGVSAAWRIGIRSRLELPRPTGVLS